jgi:hypothetical protein
MTPSTLTRTVMMFIFALSLASQAAGLGNYFAVQGQFDQALGAVVRGGHGRPLTM